MSLCDMNFFKCHCIPLLFEAPSEVRFRPYQTAPASSTRLRSSLLEIFQKAIQLLILFLQNKWRNPTNQIPMASHDRSILLPYFVHTWLPPIVFARLYQMDANGCRWILIVGLVILMDFTNFNEECPDQRPP